MRLLRTVIICCGHTAAPSTNVRFGLVIEWIRHHTILRHRLVNFWSPYLGREERKLRKASIYVLEYTSTTEYAPRCVLAPPILLNMHHMRFVWTNRYPTMNFTSATNRSNNGRKIRT